MVYCYHAVSILCLMSYYILYEPICSLSVIQLSQHSTQLFHLSRHHEISTTFLPRPGIDFYRHRPSSLLCSTHWRRRSTQPSRLESRFYVISRSTRKPSLNDNVIASAWFENCLFGWFRHELTSRFTPLLSPDLGRIRPSNGRIYVVQGAAATRVRRRQIFILLQQRPSLWSANESQWGIIKTEEMLKMYVYSEWTTGSFLASFHLNPHSIF